METEQNQENLSRKERIELRRQEKRSGENAGGGKTGRRVLIWLVVLILVGGGIYGAIRFAQKPNPQNNTTGTLTVPISASDWVEGNKNAKTVLVEYSDYECPACGLFYPYVKAIVGANQDKIEFVARNFPLAQHTDAEIAAQAAEAAGKQGKFWEMHDKLFETQADWSEKSNARDIIIGYAQGLGLNVAQFKTDIDSQDIKTKIANDYQGGINSGIDATPTFFLNGQKMNPTSFDDFTNTIQQTINGQ
jgi:protein-disulfide isomerase